MKFLLSALVAVAFTVQTIDGYVSPIPPSSQATSWTPRSFAQAPVSIDVEGIFRNEYIEWAKTHGKSMDEERFQIFKQNFMLQMQHNKKTGEFHDLNEHGDLTEAEFIAMMKGMAAAQPSVKQVVIPDAVMEPPSPKVSPPARVAPSRDVDVKHVHAELVFDEASTAATAPQQQAIPRVTVLGQPNQRSAKVNPPRALESISTPTRTSRKQYFTTGGTQVIGVKSNPRVVLWEPGMAR